MYIAIQGGFLPFRVHHHRYYRAGRSCRNYRLHRYVLSLVRYSLNLQLYFYKCLAADYPPQDVPAIHPVLQPPDAFS